LFGECHAQQVQLGRRWIGGGGWRPRWSIAGLVS
jgi:hypothetical protein